MKLIYLVIDEYHESNMTGVSQKISAKVNSFKSLKQDAILISLKRNYANDFNSEVKLKNDIIQYNIGLKNCIRGRLNKISVDKYVFKEVANFIKSFEFDYIIFRYPGASLGLCNFLKEFKGKVYFEHNTIEIEELKLDVKRKSNINFNIRPSLFLYWFEEKKLDILSEKYVAPYILKNAGGGICITSEIACHEKSKFKKYKTIITGNGFDFNSIEIAPKGFDRNGKLIIGYVVSSNLPWFGIERIIESLNQTKSNFDFEIRVAGINEEKAITHPKVKYLGYLAKQDLSNFYSQVHVTFGPLALYKKGLEYASALKIKESIAYGIPFVIGYKEEGISNNDLFKDYFLEVSNNNELIDFDRIVLFVEQFYKNQSNQTSLRELGKKHFDTEVISKLILEGINQE